MNTIPESTALRFARALAMGVILSMLLFYSMHVFGRWTVENYRPHPETTTTLLLHNTCLFFGKIHTLRPNTDIPALGKGIDGTKLSGSFMNFSDGHIMGIILTSFLAGVVIFFIRNMKRVK